MYVCKGGITNKVEDMCAAKKVKQDMYRYPPEFVDCIRMRCLSVSDRTSKSKTAYFLGSLYESERTSNTNPPSSHSLPQAPPQAEGGGGGTFFWRFAGSAP